MYHVNEIHPFHRTGVKEKLWQRKGVGSVSARALLAAGFLSTFLDLYFHMYMIFDCRLRYIYPLEI